MPSSSEPSTPDFFVMRDEIAGRFAGKPQAGGPPGAAAAAERIPERLVQAIWFERLFKTEGLKTVSGKPLTIHGVGRWNEGAGADFLAAEMSIGGSKVKGDVEVHVEASDWRRHGHAGDYVYNPVALHVVFRNDDGRSHDELHNGGLVERLELAPVLFPDLDAIRETVSPEDYPYNSEAGLGRCHEYCVTEDDQVLRRFLTAGGRARMENKIERLSAQLEGGNYSQLLYQALMTAMGVRGNKALFFLLSKRAPVEELLDYSADFQGLERVERIEAALLHVSGLAPRTDESKEDFDRPTVEYLNRINRHWSELSGYFADRLISPTKRWHSNVRPVNMPARRLAGVAHFVARNARGRDLFGPVVERLRGMMPEKFDRKAMRALLSSVEAFLTVDATNDYWAWRYTLQAKPAQRPMSLIGASRARSIAFNSLIPLLALYARRTGDRKLEEFAWKWFAHFPPLESNNVVRFMRYRLFGNDPRGKSLIDSESRQQGLFQVFHSCCNNRERDCGECYFLHKERRARA